MVLGIIVHCSSCQIINKKYDKALKVFSSIPVTKAVDIQFGDFVLIKLDVFERKELFHGTLKTSY